MKSVFRSKISLKTLSNFRGPFLLDGFAGVLQTDGYAGYNKVCRENAITRIGFRVEGDVTAPNPRRPGRARLTHPVPHMVDSLPAMY